MYKSGQNNTSNSVFDRSLDGAVDVGLDVATEGAPQFTIRSN